MDESAEWRQRFDVEVQKNQRCIKELDEVTDFFSLATIDPLLCPLNGITVLLNPTLKTSAI